MSENEKKKETLRSRIEYLHGENQKVTAKMAQLGVGIDPQAIKDMRFELLIQAVFGSPDEVERLQFEERFQEALNKALTNTAEEADKQARLARLHVPGRGVNGSKP